jgi:hypothetical protein
MNKVGIVILAANESHGDLGRVVNALQVAKEFKEADDQVDIIFDGGGVEWIPELADPEHKAHPLFDAVRDKIAGACKFCANSFGVVDGVKEAGVDLLGDYEGHPSIRELVDDDYRIITF